MTEKNPSVAADVAALVQRLFAADVKMFEDHTGASQPVLILPEGLKPHTVKTLMDPYRHHPERPKGTAQAFTLDSFIAWTQRQALEQSVLFANNDITKPSLAAIINYHEPKAEHEAVSRISGAAAAQAGWGDHRCTYHFPLSKSWLAWREAEKQSFGQADFARFLEDRITEVVLPPVDGRTEADANLLDLVNQLGGQLAGPSKMLELARGLQITEAHRIKNAVNLSSGEAQLVWETEHTNSAGEQMRVPNMFLIGIPVFENEAMYRMPVRLRYRIAEGKLKWSIKIHRPELTFDHALGEALEKVKKALPAMALFVGAPES